MQKVKEDMVKALVVETEGWPVESLVRSNWQFWARSDSGVLIQQRIDTAKLSHQAYELLLP